MFNIKNATSDTKQDIATVYKELWAHIRHIDSQRLAFSSLYSAAFAFGLNALCKGDIRPKFMQYSLLIALAAFSYLGILIATRTLITFWTHWRDIKRIQKILDPESFQSYENNSHVYDMIYADESAFRHINRFFIRITGGNTPFPVTLVFPCMYLLGMLICFTLMALLYFDETLVITPR